MLIGNKKFENYTFVMAIINLTPDSFFADSRKSGDRALFAVEQAVRDGADIIDIGAQSTRPDYIEVSPDEEIARFESALYNIKRNFDVPVSVDTYFSKCAAAALELGADMINDVWGLTHDGDMAKVIAAHNAAVCITHNSKTPLTGDVWQPVISFLKTNAARAVECGISPDKICVDGGIGFAKDGALSLELLQNYDRLKEVGYPLLLGASRKSLFGGRVEDRLPATLQSTVRAAQQGVLFVRVHDVKPNVQAIRGVYGRN